MARSLHRHPKSCKTLGDVVTAIFRILDRDKANSPMNDDAEYFFRGEKRNYKNPRRSMLDTDFCPALDREKAFWQHEDELYQEAMRLNVASFTEDRTMCERITRMQHYQLPTRFADLSVNALLATLFACEECNNASPGHKEEDGFIRVIKVSRKKMKTFTSDTIAAISCLALVPAERIKPSRRNGLGYLTYEIAKERPAFYSESEWRNLGKRLREDIQKVWAFKPLMNNPRIRNQGGLFLAFGCRDNKEPLRPSFSLEDYDNESEPSYGIAQVGFVRIDAQSKTTILEQLRLFGMTKEDVYPEISDVCKTLGKRFKNQYKD